MQGPFASAKMEAWLQTVPPLAAAPALAVAPNVPSAWLLDSTAFTESLLVPLQTLVRRGAAGAVKQPLPYESVAAARDLAGLGAAPRRADGSGGGDVGASSGGGGGVGGGGSGGGSRAPMTAFERMTGLRIGSPAGGAGRGGGGGGAVRDDGGGYSGRRGSDDHRAVEHERSTGRSGSRGGGHAGAAAAPENGDGGYRYVHGGRGRGGGRPYSPRGEYAGGFGADGRGGRGSGRGAVAQARFTPDGRGDDAYHAHDGRGDGHPGRGRGGGRVADASGFGGTAPASETGRRGRGAERGRGHPYQDAQIDGSRNDPASAPSVERQRARRTLDGHDAAGGSAAPDRASGSAEPATEATPHGRATAMRDAFFGGGGCALHICTSLAAF